MRHRVQYARLAKCIERVHRTNQEYGQYSPFAETHGERRPQISVYPEVLHLQRER